MIERAVDRMIAFFDNPKAVGVRFKTSISGGCRGRPLLEITAAIGSGQPQWWGYGAQHARAYYEKRMG
jgi:hypothetical protein